MGMAIAPNAVVMDAEVSAMAKLASIAALTVLGLASAAYAVQNPAPPDPADTQEAPPTSPEAQAPGSTDPDAASGSRSREPAQQPSRVSPPDASSPDPDAAATPHQRGAIGKTPTPDMNSENVVGLQVQSPQGETLGSVIDVVLDSAHQPEYAVISTGNDTATAVPYATVKSMIRGNKVVVDRTRLENSPQVAQDELRDKSNTKWRADADRYWRAAAIRSASPGAGSDYPKPSKER